MMLDLKSIYEEFCQLVEGMTEEELRESIQEAVEATQGCIEEDEDW